MKLLSEQLSCLVLQLFTEFEMEPHQECAYDHVIMYDGHTTDDSILGRFCGRQVHNTYDTALIFNMVLFSKNNV